MLRLGESYAEGMKRKLAQKLTPDDAPADGDGVEGV